MKDSSAKEKKWVKKWMEKSAMRGGGAPEGYCHEKLWILELGGGIFFCIFSECRSFIQTLVKTSMFVSRGANPEIFK